MNGIRLNPKYDAEWQTTGSYFNPLFPDISPKRNFPISTKENFLRMLRGEKPVYLPVLIDMLALSPRLIPDNVVRAFAFVYEPVRFGALQKGGPDYVRSSMGFYSCCRRLNGPSLKPESQGYQALGEIYHLPGP
jgi:hypothetical protein